MRPIDFLYHGARRDPNAVAVESDDEIVSYADLVVRVDALATAFQALDSTPGSRVGICAYNTLEHLIALLATYAAGKVWVPLNPRNGRKELDAMVDATQPVIIVADDACTDKFTPTPAPLLVGNEIHRLIDRYTAQHPTPDARLPTDPHIIKFSGGTTDRPKGVVQSLRCINTQAVSIAHEFDLRADDCNLIAAPLTHGTSCFVLPLLAQGGKLILLAKPGAPEILEAFERRGVTTVFLPPTFIYSLIAEHAAHERSYPSLRHLIYSAAPMPPDRIVAARDVFGPVIETAYGQVEAPQIITAMRAAEFADERNVASVGRATIMTRVEIMDAEGRLLPVGEVGEVVVRGDLLMNGYLDRPDLTDQTIVDGWLHTGDLGALDERGYLYLKARLREVIITGGFNVFPADVEAVLSRHPAVGECTVFGMDDPKWGEAVHAAVHLRPGAAATEAELIQFVKSELDSVKAPKRIHLVDSLPRTAVGKVSRRSVREAILSRLAT